jgi:all-trans-nonaprenyl-diphosphate synthase
MDLAEGEIQQGLNQFETDFSIEAYLEKSYYKTASLLANSAKAAGLLSDASTVTCEQLYLYGRNLGLAFQIVDDILDFTASDEVLGKPAGSDLASGNLTAPTLYAMQESPQLIDLIATEFEDEADLATALELVRSGDGITKSRELAKHHAKLALAQIAGLAPSASQQALCDLTDYVLKRLY